MPVRISQLGILTVALALTACAPIQGGQGVYTGARYMQGLDLNTLKPYVQLSLADAGMCAVVLAGAKRDWVEQRLRDQSTVTSRMDLAKIADQQYRCSGMDVSSGLPYRATVRIKAAGILIDVFARTDAECEAGMPQNDSEIEIVSDCKMY